MADQVWQRTQQRAESTPDTAHAPAHTLLSAARQRANTVNENTNSNNKDSSHPLDRSLGDDVELIVPDALAPLHAALAETLERFKVRAKGPLPEDVSETIRWGAQVLLGRLDLLRAGASDMQAYAKAFRSKQSSATPAEIHKEFLQTKFSPEQEQEVIDYVIALSKPGKLKMHEVLRNFLAYCFARWGLDAPSTSAASKASLADAFAQQVFFRKYEDNDNVIVMFGLKGVGKMHFPAWKKVVIANCMASYVVFKGIYLQYADNFFHHGRVWMSQLPNPDYYARFAGAAFDVMMLHAVFNTASRVNFMKFLLAFEFGQPEEDEASAEANAAASSSKKPKKKKTRITWMQKEFLQRFKMLKSSSNSERYLPGVNFADGLLEATEVMRMHESSSEVFSTPDLSRRTSDADSVPHTQLVRKHSSSALLHDAQRRFAVRKDYKAPASLSAPFSLTIAEPSELLCRSLHYEFFREQHVRIFACSLAAAGERDSTEKVDCVIYWGNVYGFPPSVDRGEFDMADELCELVGDRGLPVVRSEVLRKYAGEMPLYTSVLIPRTFDAPAFLYVAAYRCLEQCGDVRAAAWAAFNAVAMHNKEHPSRLLKHVLAPGLSGSTGASQLEPTRELTETSLAESAAVMIYIAWKRLRARVLTKWEDIIAAERAESSRIVRHRSSADMEKLIITLASVGEFQERGSLVMSEADVLLKVITATGPSNGQDAEIRVACADAIAAFCFRASASSLGISQSLIINELCRRVYAAGAVAPMLRMVEDGSLDVHHEVDPSHLTREAIVAEGAQGKVYRGRLKVLGGYDEYSDDSADDANGSDFLPVAIKVMSETTNLNFSELEFKREIATMSMLRHDNLLRCYGAITTQRKDVGYSIITEYVGKGLNGIGGSLESMIHDHAVDFSLERALTVSLHISSALSFLHANGLLHRDVKSSNVLVRSNWKVLVCDFGTTRIANPEPDREKTQMTGTLYYMAPEIFNREDYSFAADVYSFGILLWEMTARAKPFDDLRSWDIPVAVSKGTRPKMPASAPLKLVALIAKCWASKPSSRPTMPQVIEELRTIGEKRHLYI